MSAGLLEVRGLATRFETPAGVVRAVDGVDLEVEAGETLAVAGESGSGKSLTLLSIVGLVPPPGRVVAGSVRFAGRELRGLGERDLRALRGARIGLVFQEAGAALDPLMRVGAQVEEALRAHLPLTRREARARSLELLARVGLPDPARAHAAYAHELSGGMRQRAWIAAAIACGPELLLADEPTSALDVTVQAGVLDLLGELVRERSMGLVLVTHDLAVAATRADRVAVMYAGRIVEDGPARDVLERPRHPYTAALLRAQPTLEAPPPGREGEPLGALGGAPPDPAALPQGCRFHPRCALARARCGLEDPPLAPAGPARRSACFFADEVSP